MIALMLMIAVGAVAQTETLLTTITATAQEQASYSTEGVATVSFSGSSNYTANWGWWGYGWTATVTAADGYTITKCVFYDDSNRTATDSEAPFVVETTGESGNDGKIPHVNGTVLNDQSKGITKIEVYGYATPAATTYNVTVKAGTEDAANWSIDPETAEEGQTVTIKYTGTKKVKSVKAVKFGITSPAVGQIIGSDGKNYAAGATLPEGVTKVAMIAYVNGSNGLAIQLNSSPERKSWEEAKTYAEGLNTSTPIAGGTWRLPSKEDWQNMFLGCAVSGDAGANDYMDPIAGFQAKIAATGITWQSNGYWSSTVSGPDAWYVRVLLGASYAFATFDEDHTSFTRFVLGCLAF